MIFRRSQPHNPPSSAPGWPTAYKWQRAIDAPAYLCEPCQVTGRGTACWLCGSKDVTRTNVLIVK